MAQATKRVLALFDVDMTLTPARSRITPAMIDTITKMRSKDIGFGVVSGSDLVKVKDQLGEDVALGADFCFAENGLDCYVNGESFARQNLAKHIGEKNL